MNGKGSGDSFSFGYGDANGFWKKLSSEAKKEDLSGNIMGMFLQFLESVPEVTQKELKSAIKVLRKNLEISKRNRCIAIAQLYEAHSSVDEDSFLTWEVGKESLDPKEESSTMLAKIDDKIRSLTAALERAESDLKKASKGRRGR